MLDILSLPDRIIICHFQLLWTISTFAKCSIVFFCFFSTCGPYWTQVCSHMIGYISVPIGLLFAIIFESTAHFKCQVESEVLNSLASRKIQKIKCKFFNLTILKWKERHQSTFASKKMKKNIFLGMHLCIVFCTWKA